MTDGVRVRVTISALDGEVFMTGTVGAPGDGSVWIEDEQVGDVMSPDEVIKDALRWAQANEGEDAHLEAAYEERTEEEIS